MGVMPKNRHPFGYVDLLSTRVRCTRPICHVLILARAVNRVVEAHSNVKMFVCMVILAMMGAQWSTDIVPIHAMITNAVCARVVEGICVFVTFLVVWSIRNVGFDCWISCGSGGGACDICGTNGYCCSGDPAKQHYNGDCPRNG